MEHLTLPDIGDAIYVFEDLARIRDTVRGRRVEVQIGTQDVPQHQVIVGGHGRVCCVEGVTIERDQCFNGSIEQRNTVLVPALECCAPAICSHFTHVDVLSAPEADPVYRKLTNSVGFVG